MEFTVMHKDVPVTHIYVSDDHKIVKIDKLIQDGMLQPFSGNKLNIMRVYRFLKDRCYEDYRADLSSILKEAGMTENNPWEWVKRSHGVTWEDYFWIKFPGEKIKWKDVRIRE